MNELPRPKNDYRYNTRSFNRECPTVRLPATTDTLVRQTIRLFRGGLGLLGGGCTLSAVTKSVIAQEREDKIGLTGSRS